MSISPAAVASASVLTGYPHALFIDTIPADWICQLCHNVVREPLALPCPCLFCKSCCTQLSNNAANGDGTSACPTCDTPFVLASCTINSYIANRVSQSSLHCPHHV